MNISLKNRVSTSFVIVNVFVLALGFTVFFFLDSLNKDIEEITIKSNKINLLTDQIRISAVSLLKNQRKLLLNNRTQDQVEIVQELADSFSSQLQRLDAEYSDAEIKAIISRMIGYLDSLKLILSKTSLFHRDTIGISSITELSDKILDSFTEFQVIQRDQSQQRDDDLKKIISETKKTMMIVLICTFLSTILIGLIIPGKIALPFKKINDAIRELQDCNFDVSIYYDQDDEIGEIANEMNKMISSMKSFEELRTDRIIVEQKKFDALASLTKRYVLAANAKGELIYLNNQLYSLLEVSSDEVLHKSVSEIKIPGIIQETFELAIKRRTKVENIEIELTRKKPKKEIEESKELKEEVKEDENGLDEAQISNGEEKKEEIVEIIFSGYSTVVPIRGKDSSLDYYLMVLSREMLS